MSRQRIFEPVVSVMMKADTKNHDDDVEYKISYGFELQNVNPVFKVQMVQGNLLKGRQAPSYSDADFDKIVKIRELLRKEFEGMDKRLRDIPSNIDPNSI